MRAIIVDDEERSRRVLQNLIENYCPDVLIIGEEDNIDSAFESIISLKPDFVFLDIDMPPYTGFDLLRKFDTLPFEVIFVTAYDYYAIDAIKFSALYYILKPIKVEELKNSIEKAKTKLLTNLNVTTQFIKLLDPVSIDRIIINTVKEAKLIELEDIVFIESYGVYSCFHLNNGQQFTCSQKSLGDYEELLSNKGFFRIHRSYIVQLKHIASLNKQEGGEVVLKNKVALPIARRRKEDFLKVFKA